MAQSSMDTEHIKRVIKKIKDYVEIGNRGDNCTDECSFIAGFFAEYCLADGCP